ncbi:hypothetical protein ACA910_016521 [Epithemia clementina (nom. ined.)]
MPLLLDPDETFTSLSEKVGLDNRLKEAIVRLGFVQPTLVQSKCLPLALSSGRDLLVRAKTGSGKTIAYALPLLHKLLKRDESKRSTVGAVVLVPTRELCSQLQQTLQELTYYCDEIISVAILSVGQARGEKSKQELQWQESMLRDNPSAIVATPAGLLRHIRSGALTSLNESVETLVVDEADLVLSFGYSNEIAEIVKALPRICQGFLMSATLSPEVDSLKKIMLHSPVVLKLENDDGDKQSGRRLKQFYLNLPKNDKNLVIFVFLKLGLLKGKGLFFVNSTDAGYRLKLFLEQVHIRSAVLNAELPFRSRMNILDQFNVGNFDFLIATDTSTDVPDSLKEDKANDDDEKDEESSDIGDDADDNKNDDGSKQSKTRTKRSRKGDQEYGVARGLDFRHVSFVVNVDFPPNPRSYAHRVGRTARGGATGVALSLVERESKEQHEALLAVQRDQPTIPLVGPSTETLHAASASSLSAGERAMGDSTNATAAVPREQAQPTPLDFDLREIEGFRYRIEDVSRAVTKTAVREARAAELRAEMLNSERLQEHFEQNPADLQILEHDRVTTHSSRIQEHMGHVPRYLLPQGMQVAKLKKRKKRRISRNSMDRSSKDSKDPLKSFDAAIGAAQTDGDGEGAKEGDDPFAEFMEDDDEEDENDKKKTKVDNDPRIFSNAKDAAGHSTAGRNKWKQRHKKGQFSVRKSSSGKRKAVFGI